ncbi:MAG: hypothetical protein ACFFAO_07040 [Candidatus Hermodarchaeota archaeon]
MTNVQAQLKHHLETGADWEKLESPVEGAFVVKVPATKTRHAKLQLEVNSLNDDGKPAKRKGLFIGSREMLVRFEEILQEDKVYQLIEEIERVSPKSKAIVAAKKLEM